MFPISSTAPAVRPTVIDTANNPVSLVAEISVGSTSELNTVLLKQLMIAITSSENGDPLKEVRNILQQHGLDISSNDFSDQTLNAALAQINSETDIVKASKSAMEAIARQYQQVENTNTALETIQSELGLNRTKVSFSENALKATILTSEKKLDDIETTVKESNSSEEFTVHTSYRTLWAAMAKAISSIRTNYVDFYADLMQKYTEMYQAYNDYVQKASADSVTSGEDGNNVNFDNGKMQQGYDNFTKAVNEIDLGSVSNWDQMNDEQKQNMAATLKPAFDVDQSTGKISFNLEQYEGRPYFPSDGSGKVSTSSYQAWLASFNGVGTGLQSNMQSFAQRYTQANSTFDNLNKVLSGAISTMADSAKDVFKSF
ncbi:IpaD/SipD/SspD family type III secretion system needle tip protein [Kluyvera intermedia]|uniref:IpaD/SipD/SspD family type III secretion system needle tip protein n=1 Tax=Kluyvera intermedia TaxID=61648 RepID=UPI00372D0BB9